MKKLIPESLLIILTSSLTYILSFVFKLGKFEHYKIPHQIIKIDYRELIFPFLIILTLIIIILFFILIFFTLNINKGKISIIINKAIKYFLPITLIIPITLTFIYYLFNKSIYYLIISEIITSVQLAFMLFDDNKTSKRLAKLRIQAKNIQKKNKNTISKKDFLIAKVPTLKKSKKEKEKILKELDEVEFETKNLNESVEKTILEIEKMATILRLLFVISCLVSITTLILFFYNLGKKQELDKTEFLTYKDYIILDLYDYNAILKKHNNNTFDNTFYIHKFPEDKITEIISKKIGKLNYKE
ncbi:hypothetical protein ND860_18495 [Leptospira levettii]|uniref:hypothetical protein n=1 Tax=Leptospira levettii TaxID=2023178 RepID=UPI00223D9DA0|nr:hypothetical protein [Leptospira levettii]MCW7498531.1 hypothetical protein [Leptospira levettii]